MRLNGHAYHKLFLKEQKNLTTISFIIFWDFSMFYQIFLSPQVKRWAIITYKHGIYQLPHELPNDIILKIFFVHHIQIHWPNGQHTHTCNYQIQYHITKSPRRFIPKHIIQIKNRNQGKLSNILLLEDYLEPCEATTMPLTEAYP